MLTINQVSYPLNQCILIGGNRIYIKPLKQLVDGNEVEITFSEVVYS